MFYRGWILASLAALAIGACAPAAEAPADEAAAEAPSPNVQALLPLADLILQAGGGGEWTAASARSRLASVTWISGVPDDEALVQGDLPLGGVGSAAVGIYPGPALLANVPDQPASLRADLLAALRARGATTQDHSCAPTASGHVVQTEGGAFQLGLSDAEHEGRWTTYIQVDMDRAPGDAAAACSG